MDMIFSIHIKSKRPYQLEITPNIQDFELHCVRCIAYDYKEAVKFSVGQILSAKNISLLDSDIAYVHFKDGIDSSGSHKLYH